MPLPLIPIAIGAASLFAALVAANAIAEALKVDAAGKKIVIVGPTHSGKSSIYALLTGGTRQLGRNLTEGETFDFKTSKIKMEKIDFEADVIDTPSSRVGADEIRMRLEAAHLVIFVADAARMHDDRYRANAEGMASTFLAHADQAHWLLALSHGDQLVAPVPANSLGHQPGPYSKLVKLLDDPDAQVYNLLDETDADAVVQRVVRKVGKA